MGPNGELVVSALGAMDDQHMLAPGLVTYRSSFLFDRLVEIEYIYIYDQNNLFSSDGKFNHGFHKSSTGLSK